MENPVPVGQDFYQIWCLKCIILTDLIDKVYKKIPKLAKIAFHISLTFTSEPMTDERELQDLVREFEQRGLQSRSDPHISLCLVKKLTQPCHGQCRHGPLGKSLKLKFILSGTKTDTGNQGKHQGLIRWIHLVQHRSRLEMKSTLNHKGHRISSPSGQASSHPGGQSSLL